MKEELIKQIIAVSAGSAQPIWVGKKTANLSRNGEPILLRMHSVSCYFGFT